MSGALVIALNDLKRTFRERASLFWIFVGPLLFTAFFGVLFRAQPQTAVVIALVNHDAHDYVSRALGVILEQDQIQVRPAAAVPAEGFSIEIPEGTARALALGEPVSLVIHTPSDEETNFERRLRFRVQKALTATFLQANPADLPPDTDTATIEKRIAATQSISIKRGDLGVKRREITTGFQRAVPSYLVMFVFINLLVSGAGLAEERASGRLRRLFIAPLSKSEIVLGKLGSRLTIGWIQAAWMLVAGRIFFKIQWADHPWVFLGFITIFALAAASLGMLLGTLVKDPDKCRSAAIWGTVILAPLGGLWWPLEVVGSTMRTIGHFVPTGWAMEGVNSMLAYGAGAREVAPYAGAFLVLTAVALTIAVRRLRP